MKRYASIFCDMIVRFKRCTSAAAALEAAATLPIMFLILYGMEETGRMLWTRNALQYAVEGAARCAVVSRASTCSSTAQIQSYAARLVVGQTISSSIFSVTYPSCGVMVSAQTTFTPLIPIGITMNLSASDCRAI